MLKLLFASIHLLSIHLLFLLQPLQSQNPFKLLVVENTGRPSSGTGFIVKHQEGFYLVTALHVVSTDTMKKEVYCSEPTLRSVHRLVAITERGKKIHSESLTKITESLQPFAFKYLALDSSTALDIAVIKLKAPSKKLQDAATPINQLDSLLPTDQKNFIIKGFPEIKDSVFAVKGFKAKRDLLFPSSDDMFSMALSQNIDLSGMSGSPVFYLDKRKQLRTAGVFISQNLKTHQAIIVSALHLIMLLNK